MNKTFRRGDRVIIRDVYAGRIKAAVSFITVEHSDERFVGWLPAGAQFALPVDDVGNLVKDVMASHALVELEWAMPGSPGQLIVAPAGAPYSAILRFFGEDWRMSEWYINLQTPLQQTAIGFDSTDHVLDLVIAADGSSWRWKDLDEFEQAVSRGFVSPEQEAAIRAAGENALALARAALPPFDEEFLRFRPDPAWRPASLSSGWRDYPVGTPGE